MVSFPFYVKAKHCVWNTVTRISCILQEFAVVAVPIWNKMFSQCVLSVLVRSFSWRPRSHETRHVFVLILRFSYSPEIESFLKGYCITVLYTCTWKKLNSANLTLGLACRTYTYSPFLHHLFVQTISYSVYQRLFCLVWSVIRYMLWDSVACLSSMKRWRGNVPSCLVRRSSDLPAVLTDVFVVPLSLSRRILGQYR